MKRTITVIAAAVIALFSITACNNTKQEVAQQPQGINGNSHFMFQEMNNAEIADLIFGWLEKHNLK